MTKKKSQYIPALRFRWLTQFYDRILALTMRDRRLKDRLIDQIGLQAGQNVLDLGCGTGTLTVMLKQRQPQAVVTGLDADQQMLDQVLEKAVAARAEIAVQKGLAQTAPFEPESFDRVISSLFFHHLKTDDKRQTLQTVHKILKSGGKFHVADWGRSKSPLGRLAFLSVRLLDGFDVTRDHANGRFVELIREAGFSAVEETGQKNTVFGTLSYYKAVR